MKESVEGVMNDPGKKEVIAYINKLSAFLSAKKKKAILEADLLKISREIKYMGFGIEETQKKIDENRASINMITPEITGFRNKLASLEQEKRPLEDEYNRLLDIQINLEKKRSDVENKKALVERLLMEISNIAKEMEALKERESEISARTRKIQEEISADRSLLIKLEEEIGVITATRDLLGGHIPEFIDIEEFPSLKSTEQGVEEYTSEVGAIMKKMANDIATYKKEIEENQNLEVSLALEKKNLGLRLKALEPEIGPDVDKDRLSREIAALSAQEESFKNEVAALREEISRLAPKVTEHENRLFVERKKDMALNEKVQYLTERKKHISAFDDVEKEMERLKRQITKSKLDLEANNGYLPIINKVKEDTQAINRKMGMSLDDYGSALLELQHILLLGHGVLYGNGAG
ncbi:MAG TPA: hypothetical protein HPP58_00190 [Deltaproteobacteria bacterium]|nr:hypothetical protein [Deltaproteobacteria bacterium]HIJ35662.1 hypothetical protein [Deltaproteobacteria bacterium]HIJ39463.1 hypothetical protein [Deltaproteobacteria bacterium]